MTNPAPAFQMYPNDELANPDILLMDWDARGMHMHYTCIAWNQDPPGTVPADDAVLRKWVANPSDADWERLKPQIFRAWKLEGGRLVHTGLQREFEKQRLYRESRKHGAEARWRGNARASGMQSTRNALQSSSSFIPSSPKKEDIAVQQVPNAAAIPLTDDRQKPSVDADFEAFWKLYPARKGKRIGRPEAIAKWQRLDVNDRRQVLVAVQHYATSELVLRGIGIKDPHRWLKIGKNNEPWRDWIEPESKQTGKELHDGKVDLPRTGFADRDYRTGVF